MSRDTKYLRQRDGIWHLNFRIPKNCGLPLAGHHVQQTLGTRSLAVARNLRDRYVRPLLATAGVHEAIAELLRLSVKASDEAREQLAHLAAECEAEQIAGVRSVFQSAVSVSELMDAYCRYREQTNPKAVGSHKKYRQTAAVMVWALGANRDANTVTKQDMTKVRDRLIALPKSYFIRAPKNRVEIVHPGEPTLSARTVQSHIVTFGAAYKWGIAGGLLSCRNPCAIPVEVPKPTPKNCPTTAEVAKLCAMPRNTSAVGDFEWRAIPLIARYSAARVQEIAGLHAADVLESQGVPCLHFRHYNKRLKTIHSQRLVPIADAIAPLIAEAVKKTGGEGRLFPRCGDSADGSVLGKTFNSKWNAAAKTVGPFSFHCLRIYAQVKMKEGGVEELDRKRIMGKEVKDDVLSAYTPAELRRFREAVNRIEAVEKAAED